MPQEIVSSQFDDCALIRFHDLSADKSTAETRRHGENFFINSSSYCRFQERKHGAFRRVFVAKISSSPLPEGDVWSRRSLAGPAPHACKSASWKCRSVQEWFAPSASRRHSPPCGWRTVSVGSGT